MAIMHAGDNSLQRKVFEVREKRRLLTAAEDSSGGKQKTTVDGTDTTQVDAEDSSAVEQKTTVDGTDTNQVDAEDSSAVEQKTTVDGTDTTQVEAEIEATTLREETTLEKEAEADKTETAITVVTQQEEESNPETDSQGTELNGTKNPACAETRVSDLEFKEIIPSEIQASQELMGKKIWIKQQRVVGAEVAGDDEGPRGDQPQLVRIKRLDSQQISELETKMGDDEVFAKPQKKVGFTDDVAEGEKEESFTHIVVGGVVHKIPIEKARTSSTNESSQVKMRNKAPSSRTKLDRRVSCKDLGKGDCEGWLYKRKQKDRTLSKHWDKRWCVLKNFNLFYYKNKDDLKAEGVIHLPAFQVSPAPKLKTKKSAFKIHNGGTTFYFASERQDDMSKWMNKMGLAAINYDASQDITTSGFNKPHKFFTSSVGSRKGYSESEDEEEFGQDGGQLSGSVLSLTSLGSAQSSLMSGSVLSLASNYSSQGTIMSGSVQSLASLSSLDTIGGSTDGLHSMLRSIQAQDLTIDGKDKVWQRHSQCMTQSLVAAAEQEVERIKRLHSLQRTLKAKELELQEIEELAKKPLTSHNLHSFIETHHLTPSDH